MANQYPGLARGPIDHNASAVINGVANSEIVMGQPVGVVPAPANEKLPRIQQSPTIHYGIAVGGDTDGIYGNGFVSAIPQFLATASAGQGIVVVTKGRCLATVDATTSDINVGDPLKVELGIVLVPADSTDEVIARALASVTMGESDVIPVDVQREGTLP